MAEKRNDTNKLIDKAIVASIKFETLMDSIDFDSWLANDTYIELKKNDQDISPYKNYKSGKKKLEKICKRMMNEGDQVLCISALDKYLIYQLFEAKLERLKARTSSNKEDEEKLYKKSLQILHIALNKIKESNIANSYWNILLYNDLSICYAGSENSSISRGYAEEARKIIENDKSYKDFEKKFNANAPIGKDEFLSSKFYDLYTITLFNQALAERRSYMSAEAEKNLKKIIKYGDRQSTRNNCLLNFNYYSAKIYLSDLYIDQGRGKEAVELSNSVIKALELNDNDIRYWNAYLYTVSALIDQCKYDKARELLLDKFIENNKSDLTLRKRHKVTAPGFKGMNYYARCQIEMMKNTLKAERDYKESELIEAQKIIKENIKIIIERKQKGAETKAYKNLSDIYKILGKEKDNERILNLIKFFSNGEVSDLNKFVEHKKVDYWIENCDDLDALEGFSEIICDFICAGNRKDSICNLLKKLKEKIISECDEKDQPSRAERNAEKINEALEEAEDDKGNRIKYYKNAFKNCGIDIECIRERLDRNEKKFDSVLFERSKLKQRDNLIEVIILRRWNSFSPGLLGSLGGGYLVRIKNGVLTHEKESCHNIVIDPGYSFLQNFRSEGFFIDDIDTIIITHSHLDHCAELLPIMDLIFQINKRYEKYNREEKRDKKRVNLCLSKGAFNKFSSYIMDPDWQKQLKDVIIIENLPDSKWEINDRMTVTAIPTPHMDLGGVKAIGLKIEIKGESNNFHLGFTGDTPWYQNIKKDFNNCDLLCVHLGSIKYEEIGYSDARYIEEKEKRKLTNPKPEFNNVYAKANHLLFCGTKKLIDACSNKNNLIIVGEFGEELKYGLRNTLCEKLSSTCRKCLPCDIGLYIAIDGKGTKRVRCCFCEEFVVPNEIETFPYGQEDAIHYICKTCKNTLSELQKQTILEHRLTRH